jgi:hypothetical protein
MVYNAVCQHNFMSRFSEPLKVGQGYERKALVELWGLGGFQALGRGVFTPMGERQIYLFVTCQWDGWITPYNNFLVGDLLFWDGENGLGSDQGKCSLVALSAATGHGER